MSPSFPKSSIKQIAWGTGFKNEKYFSDQEAYNLAYRGYENEEFKQYCENNKWWLNDYALYMAIKDSFGGKSWIEWDEDIRIRKQEEREEQESL